MLSEYHVGLLLRFEGVPGMKHIDPDKIPKDFHPMYKDLILWVHDTLYKLEKTAFYAGFYKAFGFGAYPCIYCEHCVAEESSGPVDRSMKRLCRHMDKVRPSMEAAGMDVFATARKVGWDSRPSRARTLSTARSACRHRLLCAAPDRLNRD